jgi:hypothetical protein
VSRHSPEAPRVRRRPPGAERGAAVQRRASVDRGTDPRMLSLDGLIEGDQHMAAARAPHDARAMDGTAR